MDEPDVDDLTRNQLREMLRGVSAETKARLVEMARTGELARVLAEKRAILQAAASLYPDVLASLNVLADIGRVRTDAAH